jgi:hypothetical protein
LQRGAHAPPQARPLQLRHSRVELLLHRSNRGGGRSGFGGLGHALVAEAAAITLLAGGAGTAPLLAADARALLDQSEATVLHGVQGRQLQGGTELGPRTRC